MTVHTSMIVKRMLKGALLFILGAASAAVFAQNRVDAAFSAAGTSCDDITWSRESLASYPNIASACQEVMQRDGKYYVKFEGEVRRVANRGEQVTIDFVGGDTITLSPPENMSLTIDGRARQARDLRPGDELTFYVPQNQLEADFFADEPATTATPPQVVPITPPAELLAQGDESSEPTLPATASVLPYGAVTGVGFLVAAASAPPESPARPACRRCAGCRDPSRSERGRSSPRRRNGARWPSQRGLSRKSL
jgi:hypothetical protein